MRKVVAAVATILMLVMTSTFVYAGSIPEDLLTEDQTQIFFAEVIYYQADEEASVIEFSPVKKIKGDVKLNSNQMAYNFNTVGNFEIEEENIYLFTYFDENNPTDIFKATSTDTETLKLENIQGDMWKRFEQYLNEGRYEEAEQERLERLGLLDTLMEEANTTIPNEKSKANTAVGFSLAVAAFAVIVVVIAMIKKKRG